jgi:hypothetical protein
VKAIAAVERMGAQGREALPVLESLLNDEDTALRYCALRAIAAIDPASPALAVFQQTPSPQRVTGPPARIKGSQEDPYASWLYSRFSDLYRPPYEPRPLEKATWQEVEAGLRSSDWVKVQASLWELVERDELERCLPQLIEVFAQDRPEAHDPIGRMMVEALARLGPKARPALPALLEGLESKSEQYVRMALILVGSDAPDYVPHLQAVLAREQARCAANPLHTTENQLILAYLLWKNSRSADALATLTSGLKAKQRWERERAIMLLGETGPDAAAAVSLLIPFLQDVDSGLCAAAIQALEKIGPDSRPAVPVLKSLLVKREHQELVAQALLTIAPDDSAIAGNLAQILKDLSSSDREAHIRAIGQLQGGAASALPELRRLASSSRDEYAAVEAAVSIWKIEQTPQSLVALLRRFRASRREPIVGGGKLAEVGPAAKVAVPILVPLADCSSNANADDSAWQRTQAIIRMQADEWLIDELVWAAMYAEEEMVRKEAFDYASAKVLPSSAPAP